jgi:hypothetical protein
MLWRKISNTCQQSECNRFTVCKVATGPLKDPPRGAKGDDLIAWRYEAYRRLEPKKRFLGFFADAPSAKRHCTNVAALAGEPPAAKLPAGSRRASW